MSHHFFQPTVTEAFYSRIGRAHENRCRRCALRFLAIIILLLFWANAGWAMPLKEYRERIKQAVSALDTLAQSDEDESLAEFDARSAETVRAIRTALPETAIVEWQGATLSVDNSWLHQELEKYEKARDAERNQLSARIKERLQAIEERLGQVQEASATNANKAESSKLLAEILQRPEYARRIKQESALSRWGKQILEWLRNLFPKPEPLTPGSAGLFSMLAQVFVIVLALAVLAYVFKMFAPHLLQKRKSKKKGKGKPRIVLGERLEPDQSAADLLAEAEVLARRGELRAAIRKAYIALLVELGERKVISLAQHKTNHDYLRALREVEPLYINMARLTDSFERHWYGFASANEDDWLTFRAGCKQTLRQ